MVSLEQIIDFPISLPFRLKCKKIGKSFLIGPNYSFIGCDLSSVSIDDNVKIGLRAWRQTVALLERSKPVIKIGDNTYIGRNVVI